MYLLLVRLAKERLVEEGIRRADAQSLIIALWLENEDGLSHLPIDYHLGEEVSLLELLISPFRDRYMVLLELPHRPVVEIEGMLLKTFDELLPLTIGDEEVMIYIIYELEVFRGSLKVKSPALSFFLLI